MKALAFTAGFILTVFLGFQVRRVLHTEKDVYTHQDEDCSVISTGFYTADLTRYSDFMLGLDLDPSVFSEGAKKAKPGRIVFFDQQDTAKAVSVKDFPTDVGFNPFGFYLLKPDSLYVLNYAYGPEPMRVEIFNLTATADAVTAQFLGSVSFAPELQLTISDLIVISQEEMYLAQRSAVPLAESPSFLDKLKEWANDYLQIEAAYVHRCTFKLNSLAECRALESTKAVSISGITKDKFGDFMVGYSSIDSNSVKYYERNWRNGEFDLQHTVYVRDNLGKLEWDEGWQRVYTTSLPWPIHHSDYVGAVELRMWEAKSGKVGRRLLMTAGRFKGGEVAARFQDYVYVGSMQDQGLLKCPIS
jgi:hypothetical protein